MCVKVEPTYYRLELDDYSAAAFTSFGKYYYGTLEDLRCFFGELAHDEKLKKQFKELLSTFQAFEEGQQDLSHSIAYSGNIHPRSCAAAPQGTRHFGKLQMDTHQHMGQVLLYALRRSQIRTSLACLRRGILPCNQSYVFKTTVYRNDRQVESCRNNALGIPVHSHRKPIQLLESIS